MTNLPNPSANEILARIEERTRRQSAELLLTRERAANWSKGIGALLVTALAFSLIKGRDDLTSLDPAWAAGVGYCLVGATVFATVAAYALFRASYGPLRPLANDVSDHLESSRTMRALTCGLVTTVIAFVALFAAVAITWYGPDADGPRISVTDQDGTVWCGEPKATAGGELTLQVKGQLMEFDLDTVSRLDAVAACTK